MCLRFSTLAVASFPSEDPIYHDALLPLPPMSYTSSFLRWLQRKRYQYEVTFSLYMLTPTEKFIFSTIALISAVPSPVALFHESMAYLEFSTLICAWSLRLVPVPLHLYDHHRCFALPTRTHCQHVEQSLVLLRRR